MKHFDVLDFVRLVKSHAKMYYIILGIVFILATVKVFLQSNYYTSSEILAPEFSSGLSSASSGIGNLASLAGINLGSLSGGDEDAIHPGIYAEVVKSTKFLQDLLKMQVETEDAEFKGTLGEYFLMLNKPLIHIPFPKGKKKDVSEFHKGNAAIISEDEMGLIEALGDNIVVKMDNTTGLVTISATAEDPYIAMCVADSVSEKLQEYIYDYRTKKASLDMAYSEKIVKEAKHEYLKISAEYSKFVDSHQGLFLAEYKTKETFLENEMTLKYQIYNQALQQAAMSSAKLQSRIPAYSVVQPAIVPIRKSGPHRILSILLAEFVAFFLLSIYWVLKDQFKNHE